MRKDTWRFLWKMWSALAITVAGTVILGVIAIPAFLVLTVMIVVGMCLPMAVGKRLIKTFGEIRNQFMMQATRQAMKQAMKGSK